MAVFWIGQRKYRTKTEAQEAVRAVLHGHPRGTELSGEDFDLVRDLLDMHPEALEKIGLGVASILVDRGPQPEYPKYNSFYLVRTDGFKDDFSYQACFKHPSLRSKVHNVMQVEIRSRITTYFDSRIAAGTFTSDESGVPLQQSDTAVSHFRGPSFAQIADEFAVDEGGWEAIELTASTEQGLGRFVDRDQAERWSAWWEDRAVLGLLTQPENRARPRT